MGRRTPLPGPGRPGPLPPQRGARHRRGAWRCAAHAGGSSMTGQQRFLDRCAQDLALLASGQETGWWDETGRPAPWPEGFWLVDDTINVHWHPTDHRKEEQPTDDHPF